MTRGRDTPESSSERSGNMTAEEKSILDAFGKYLDSYSKRDIEGCMSSIAQSKPVTIFGTNENEVFASRGEVRSAFERDFGSMTDIRWGAQRNVRVEVSTTLASLLVELPLFYRSEGKDVETLFRYALTFTFEGGQWKICSGMASVPFAAGTYEFGK
jgi:ketosteroid isomerase-like protein